MKSKFWDPTLDTICGAQCFQVEIGRVHIKKAFSYSTKHNNKIEYVYGWNLHIIYVQYIIMNTHVDQKCIGSSPFLAPSQPLPKSLPLSQLPVGPCGARARWSLRGSVK